MLHRTSLPARLPTTGLAILLAASVVALAQLGGPTVATLFEYERGAVANGEVWRLASGPWVHLSGAHALLNLGGLALVFTMFARWVHPLRQLLLLVAIGALTSLVLFAAFPLIDWMVGLSGPLHGLFVNCACVLLSARDPLPAAPWWRGPRFGWALLAGVALKIGAEHALQTFGIHEGPPAWLGGPVLIEAHLAGALAGLMTYAAWRGLTQLRAALAQAGSRQRK